MTKECGDVFQEETKYDRKTVAGRKADVRPKPSSMERTEAIKKIPLPPPVLKGGERIWKALLERRTTRAYKPEPLTVGDLSQLLWAAYGKTGPIDTVLKSAPSAGALYPLEIYVMANDVLALDKGIYVYLPEDHSLAMLKEGDFSKMAAEAALGQQTLAKCGAVFFMTAVIERSRWKYGQRAYRYIYLDAGHSGQNIALASQAMGLGSCPIGAFYDDEMNAVLGVDGVEETLLYAYTVGR